MRNRCRFASKVCFSLSIALMNLALTSALLASPEEATNCRVVGDPGDRSCSLDHNCSNGQSCRKIKGNFSDSCDCTCTYASPADCVLPDSGPGDGTGPN